MQIKRFEASNMSEALKMIKKEFGEEAVILSARNNRPVRTVFGRRKNKGVVVTAAVDYDSIENNCPEKRSNSKEKGRTSCEFRNDQGATVASKIIKQFRPITPTGQRIWQLKSRHNVKKAEHLSIGQQLNKCLKKQGLEETIADLWSQQADKLVDESLPFEKQLRQAMNQLLSAQGLIAPIRQHRWRKNSGVFVIAGPHGSGKTTMVAKLAIRRLLDRSGNSAMVSLDKRDITGSFELEIYGRAAAIKVLKANDAGQLQDVFQETSSTEHIYVDTPAFGQNDIEDVKHLRKMLAKLPGAKIYLTINVTARQEVIENWIGMYSQLGVEAVILTHLDECMRLGHVLNCLVRKRLPIVFLSDGPTVPDNLKRAEAQYLSDYLLKDNLADTKISENNPDMTELKAGEHYVANRNSDIFHRKNCKAVKRIYQENMVFFNDQADAIEQGYKPCRMCCSELVGRTRIQRNIYMAGAR